jgi:hypothetical protein
MRVDGTNDWTLMGYEYDSKTNLIRVLFLQYNNINNRQKQREG